MRNNMSVEPGALENLMRLESGAYLLPVTALAFPPAVGRALAGRADLHLHARSATVGANLFCHTDLEPAWRVERGAQKLWIIEHLTVPTAALLSTRQCPVEEAVPGPCDVLLNLSVSQVSSCTVSAQYIPHKILRLCLRELGDASSCAHAHKSKMQSLGSA